MLRHLKYTEAVRQLAGMARQKAMDRDVLYHGTRFAELIQKRGILSLFRSRRSQGVVYALPGRRGVLGIAGAG